MNENTKQGTVTSLDGKETISLEEFDRRFEAGEEIDQFLDYANARWPGREVQRVNVDFPRPMLERIDREADRIGITRQGWIKFVLSERLRRMG